MCEDSASEHSGVTFRSQVVSGQLQLQNRVNHSEIYLM